MKIVRVEATALRIPVGFEQLGVDHKENAALTYVAVETDTGLVGHGITGITQAPR